MRLPIQQPEGHCFLRLSQPLFLRQRCQCASCQNLLHAISPDEIIAGAGGCPDIDAVRIRKVVMNDEGRHRDAACRQERDNAVIWRQCCRVQSLRGLALPPVQSQGGQAQRVVWRNLDIARPSRTEAADPDAARPKQRRHGIMFQVFPVPVRILYRCVGKGDAGQNQGAAPLVKCTFKFAKAACG